MRGVVEVAIMGGASDCGDMTGEVLTLETKGEKWYND